MKFIPGFIMLIAIGVNAQESVLNAAFLSPKKTYPLHVQIGKQSDPISHKMYALIEETGEDTVIACGHRFREYCTILPEGRYSARFEGNRTALTIPAQSISHGKEMAAIFHEAVGNGALSLRQFDPIPKGQKKGAPSVH
jgi:hypothetical protein